jgi:hypothetical protein
MTKKVDDAGFTSKRTVKKPCGQAKKRSRQVSVASNAAAGVVSQIQLDAKKNLNVSMRGHFYEKAASRRIRHRAALMASGSASAAVPLALNRRQSSTSSTMSTRCAEGRPPTAHRVLVDPQFEDDPNLQAVKGKPVSFKGRADLVVKAQQIARKKMNTGARFGGH